MIRSRSFALLAVLFCAPVFCADPEIPAITSAIKACVEKHEVSGAVSLVVTRKNIVHVSAVGQADITAGTPMAPDTMFWIASMTKPITAAAIMMLQDEGKLSIEDPIGKYIPELATLKTKDGKEYKLTLRQCLTHTSAMGEATPAESDSSKTLAELIPHFAEKPLQFEPGSKWSYCQSGINTLGRIVEIVSKQPLQEFLSKRFFEPLGMKDTTFYPTKEQLPRIVKGYKLADDKLTEVPPIPLVDPKREHFPAANGGLYSTAADYARFAQMLLNQGSLDGKQYLKPESVNAMSTIQTGDLKVGFTDGNGWGLGCCVVRKPQGVSEMLSPGTFGHGGAWGTQAWMDPEKGVAYILMVQRANFPNADNSDVRKAFQAAAVEALK